jgi:cob(I)alamin adenosyltransferase
VSESRFYTRRGDNGFTGLLGPERVPKHDLRPEAYGTVDEAQAALGLARASGCAPASAEILVAIQRDLYALMAELAALGDAESPLAGSVTAEHVRQLEDWIAQLEARVEMPREFVLPGDSRAGAALHLARTIVRRAERPAVRLYHDGSLSNRYLLAYLNRLSSLLFVMACDEDQARTGTNPTRANGSAEAG